MTPREALAVLHLELPDLQARTVDEAEALLDAWKTGALRDAWRVAARGVQDTPTKLAEVLAARDVLELLRTTPRARSASRTVAGGPTVVARVR